MLSKSFFATRRFAGLKGSRFSSLRGMALELLNRDDVQNPHYIASTYNPAAPLEGHKGVNREATTGKFDISRLKNGIHVVTRSPSFPSHVDLGILVDVGTRDENQETSGALLSIKNTYYKTVMNTNETINYGMVQMSGGDFTMEYDQESTYWKASCFSHDVVDIFRMMSDCALEPRSVVAANVGQEKNKHSHKLDNYIHTGEEFNDTLFRTAYGLKTLGMPLKGLKSNIGNLGAYTLQKFQLENINPRRIYVCAAGVENHQEFVDLVENKLGSIPAAEIDSLKARQASEYLGGEARIPTDEHETHIALAFQSVAWTHQNMCAFNVINTILGNASSFSTGGPGKGMHSRTTKNLLNKHAFVESASGLNFHFSDSGLWGLQIAGPSDQGNNLVNALVKELRGLAEPIPAIELQRAKNILKSNVFMALERQGDILEEGIKSVRTFGSLMFFNEYAKNIDAVTGDQINKIVKEILKTKPTFVAKGGETARLPSLDKILNQLQ